MFKQPSYKEQQRVLHSKFNIITHKKTFMNYLEVIITDTGEIMYAVPSHMEKLIDIYTGRHDITREELYDMILHDPSCFGLDMCQWLLNKLHCICVWTEVYRGEPNQIQLNKLKTLRLSGIYHGPVHDIYKEEQERMTKIANELKEFAKNYNKEN